MRSPAEDLIAAGNAAYQAGRFVEAIDYGRRAVEIDSAHPWAHNLLGAACAEEMEFDEARRAFVAAVAADPSIAISRLNLGYALILAGEFAAAETELRAALAIEPDMGAAYVNLTWIHKAAPDDPLIANLEELRRRSRDGGDPALRAQYAFALGKCYDDIGEYDEAFACFQEGNDVQKIACDTDEYPRRLERLRAVFSHDFFSRSRQSGWRSKKPVFIIGMPRCGSSLLEERLARDSRFAALGERPDVGRIIVFIGSRHPSGLLFPDWVSELRPESFTVAGRKYVETIESRHPSVERFVDKNLANFHYAGMVRAMLPDAAVIHCRRNALDVCLSCYFQHLRPAHAYKFNLTSLGLYYRFYSAVLDHWSESLGDLITIDYESFVERPETEYARVVGALGLTPSPLSVGVVPRSIQTSSAFQARQPITRTSIGRWRNYERHLAPLIEALGDLAGV
jgi:tetratricopeptide (TPR) repeat protein